MIACDKPSRYNQQRPYGPTLLDVEPSYEWVFKTFSRALCVPDCVTAVQKNFTAAKCDYDNGYGYQGYPPQTPPTYPVRV